MRQVVFVTGGTRSGKSDFAQRWAERWEGRLLYVATAEVRDKEMERRVELHRNARGDRWSTLEEPLDLVEALDEIAASGGGLVDCLTLWTSNLIEENGEDDSAILEAAHRFSKALEDFEGRVVIVTNEVGSGIVPENRLARRFRDLAGKINQVVAGSATDAFLVVSGKGLRLED